MQETNKQIQKLSSEQSKLEARQAVRNCSLYCFSMMALVLILHSCCAHGNAQVLKKMLYSRFGQSINLEDS